MEKTGLLLANKIFCSIQDKARADFEKKKEEFKKVIRTNLGKLHSQLAESALEKSLVGYFNDRNNGSDVVTTIKTAKFYENQQKERKEEYDALSVFYQEFFGEEYIHNEADSK